MDILGLHCNTKREDEQQGGYAFHDSAAVLLRDGAIVAAIEDERLSRLKHANTFPVRAIQSCLKMGRISLDQVDCIAVNRGEAFFDQLSQYEWFTNSARWERTGRAVLADCFQRSFGIDVSAKLFFSPHHIAHAWSACAASGFDESLVYVADGDGDSLSGLVLLAEGKKLTTLREYSIPKSLGNLYELMIGLIGYGRFDEYKAMGLAPYGNPAAFEELFSACYHLLPDGDYEIAQPLMWVARLEQAGVIERARRRHQQFTQEHKDIAAALQTMLQRIVLHVLSNYRRAGRRKLCMAGGVFHNCSVNGAVLYSRLFDRVFVQPAAHDAGGAYGAAVHAAVHHGERFGVARWEHVYFGSGIGDAEEIRNGLERWREFVHIEDLGGSLEQPAQLLAGGEVIGWVHGRAEFGPRALGNRSILADPRPAGNKDRINAMVKKREAFRPFAPAILMERLRDYFEVPENELDFPFMIFVLKVRQERRAELGAVTHVDGTARVQTVSRNTNPRFWDLIHAFEQRTGVPVLLNTSFNSNTEPIVDSLDDAISCYLTTRLDALVIGDYLVRKRSPEIANVDLGSLIPQIPAFRRLVKQCQIDPHTQRFENVHSVQTTRSGSFGPAVAPISESVFRILQHTDGRRSLNDLIVKTGVCNCETAQVYEDFQRLWTERVVAMAPMR